MESSTPATALDLRLPVKRPLNKRTSSTESEDEESNTQRTGISHGHDSNTKNRFLTAHGAPFLPRQTSPRSPNISMENTLNPLSGHKSHWEENPRDIHQPSGLDACSTNKKNLLVGDLLDESPLSWKHSSPKKTTEESPSFVESDLSCTEIQTTKLLFEMGLTERKTNLAKSSISPKLFFCDNDAKDGSAPLEISSANTAEKPLSNGHLNDRTNLNENSLCAKTGAECIQNCRYPTYLCESSTPKKRSVSHSQRRIPATSSEGSASKRLEDLEEKTPKAEVADDTMSVKSFDVASSTENPHYSLTAGESAANEETWAESVKEDTASVLTDRRRRRCSHGPHVLAEENKNESPGDAILEARQDENDHELQLPPVGPHSREPLDLLARSVYKSVYRKIISALRVNNLDSGHIMGLLESGHLTEQLEAMLDTSVRNLVLMTVVRSEESPSPTKTRSSPHKNFSSLDEARGSPKTPDLRQTLIFQDNSSVLSTPSLKRDKNDQLYEITEKQEHTDETELCDRPERFRGLGDTSADAHRNTTSDSNSQRNCNPNIWHIRSVLDTRNEPTTETANFPRAPVVERTTSEERVSQSSINSSRLDIEMEDTERSGETLAREDNPQESREQMSDPDGKQNSRTKTVQRPCLITETRGGQDILLTRTRDNSGSESLRVMDRMEGSCMVGEIQHPSAQKERREPTGPADSKEIASSPETSEGNRCGGKRRSWIHEESTSSPGCRDERGRSSAETVEAGPDVDRDEAFPEADDVELLQSYQVADDKDNVQMTDSGVTLTLTRTSMWRAFNSIGTEMIINRSGRRMFPFVTLQLSGLDNCGVYDVEMEIVPADRRRYKFVNKTWAAVGVADAPIDNSPYPHVDSPNTGEYWVSRQIQFSRVKLTNNRDSSDGNILLHSMHKYVVQIVVRKVQDLYTSHALRTFRFRLNITSFIAVTAYQNEYVTRLKIHNNPFAKAFRDSSIVLNSKKGTTKRREISCADNSAGSDEDGPATPKKRETEYSRVKSAVRDSPRHIHTRAAIGLAQARVEGHFGLHLRHPVSSHDAMPMTQPFIWMPGMASPWMGPEPGVVNPYFLNLSRPESAWKPGAVVKSSSMNQGSLPLPPSPLPPPLALHADFSRPKSPEHPVVSPWPPRN